MVSISRHSIFRDESRTGKPIYFTAWVEDEVIRYVLPHKLDRPIVNPSNKIWEYSTQNETPTSPFHIGGYLKYTNEIHNEMM